jgi:hypothetical protein
MQFAEHFGVLVEFIGADHKITGVLFRSETEFGARFLSDAIKQFSNSSVSSQYPNVRYVSMPVRLGRT